MYGHGYGFFGIGWMWPFAALLIVVVVIIVVRALGQRGGDGPRSPGQTPEQILKARYARGEIDRDEYQRRLEDLRR